MPPRLREAEADHATNRRARRLIGAVRDCIFLPTVAKQGRAATLEKGHDHDIAKQAQRTIGESTAGACRFERQHVWYPGDSRR